MTPLPVGAIVAAFGAVAGTSGASLAAQITDQPTGIITITSAGATSAAVGALVWVVRAMLSGRLVPRSTEALDEKLIEITAVQAEVLRELTARRADDRQREIRFYELIDSLRGQHGGQHG